MSSLAHVPGRGPFFFRAQICWQSDAGAICNGNSAQSVESVLGSVQFWSAVGLRGAVVGGEGVRDEWSEPFSRCPPTHSSSCASCPLSPLALALFAVD